MRQLIAIALVVFSPLISAAADLKQGDKVFVKPGAEATMNDAKVEIKTIPSAAWILKTKVNLLLISARSVSEDRIEVWVRKSDVMTTDQALAYYSDKIEKEPANPQAWLCRSRIWTEIHKPTEALEDASEAIRLDPQSPDGYMRRGLICRGHVIKRQQDTSFDDFSEVIRLAPNDASAYSWRAYGWDEKGDIDNAINDYTMAIKLGSKEASNYFYRGYYWQEKGDFENAVRDYSEAIELEQTRGEFYNGFAWLRATCPDERFRDGKVAIEYATKACDLTNSWNQWADFDTLATAYAETGDFTNAVKWAKKALELAPADEKQVAAGHLELFQSNKPYRDASMYSDVAWRRATSLADRYRDGKIAVEFATKACELTSWKDSKTLGTLAAAYAELGDFANAVKWGEKSLELASEARKQRATERLDLYRANKPFRDGPHTRWAD
jgi:tetratricopeptide (TPR) repeat protein